MYIPFVSFLDRLAPVDLLNLVDHDANLEAVLDFVFLVAADLDYRNHLELGQDLKNHNNNVGRRKYLKKYSLLKVDQSIKI